MNLMLPAGKGEVNERAQNHRKSRVKEIHGDDVVKSVTLENVKTKETSEMEVDAVFIYVGLTPNTSFVDWMTEDGRRVDKDQR